MAANKLVVLLPAACMFACSFPMLAQVPPPPLERLDRPGGSGQPFPEFRKPAPAPQIVLPPSGPETQRPGGLSTALGVYVRRIRVVGGTVFTEEELRPILAQYENRELTVEDLDELRHRLSLTYSNAGYINSGAVIPDQDVADGVLTLQVVEGRLSGIEIAGEHHFRRAFIAGRVALGAGEPLNVRGLQEAIQLLLQNPQIERINAELAPGAQRGEAVLRMDVKEAKRWSVGFSMANNRSPVVGSVRSELSAAARNLSGFGDMLGVRIGHTHGLDDESFGISIPVSARDTLLSLRKDRVKSRVIEPPFDRVDVRSESESSELGVSHPLYRTLHSSFTVGANLYWRDNATSLLGVPFSFTPGLADGRAKVTALRLFGDWLERTQDSVVAARVTLANGLRRGGATTSTANTPDSQYWTVLTQLQWARRLSEDGRQMLLRIDMQQASGELLPSEKFAIGGSESVRGYRENQIVRDKGWIATAEYRHPVGRVPIPALTQSDSDGLLSAALFADFGRAWDHFGGPARRFIWSYGPGARWDIADGISAQLYWGFRQKKVIVPNNNLQDHGLHFRIAAARAF